MQETLRSLMVCDLATGQAHAVASGNGFISPAWSPDSLQIVFTEYTGYEGQIVALLLADCKRQPLSQVGIWWSRPHVSGNGRCIYCTSNTSGTGQLYRLSRNEKRNAESNAGSRKPLRAAS